MIEVIIMKIFECKEKNDEEASKHKGQGQLSSNDAKIEMSEFKKQLTKNLSNYNSSGGNTALKSEDLFVVVEE
jgi:hypothetical protein